MLRILLAVLLVLPCKLDAVCPAGWDEYQSNCYKKFNTPTSWDDARTSCRGENGDLAIIMDMAENTFVKNTYGAGNWLGFTGCQRNRMCTVKFTPITWDNFATGQPDDEPQTGFGIPHHQFAVLNRADGTWEDQPNTQKHSYICKKSDDPCKNLNCDTNGGTCDRPNAVCKCKPGYSGKRCDIAPCDTDPCQNGGTCEEVNTGYKCTCIDHYSGKDCEVPPPCEAKKPCKNGVCKDVSDVDYVCKCDPMWTGKNCDERPCDKRPCVNFKKCINLANGNYKCICLDNWTGPKCDKEGPANGDPHYVTFDGRRYDFMGRCEYVYAKDCGKDHAFEVLQQNEPCGGGSVSCTRSIRVLFQEKEVKFERGGVVYVDGVRIKKFPWTLTGSTTTKITRYGRGALLDVPDLLFSVRWDGFMGILVDINQRYDSNMCGLMGNADGNPNNDFQLPDKTITTDIANFANAWRKNRRCVNGIVPPDPCKKLTQAQYNAIKQKCGKMKQAPFKQCNERITPDVRYIPDCEYDLCAMTQNPSAAWCQALDTYDKSCTSKGLNIDWEGKPGFEECGDPCAEMPCFNGAQCKNDGKTNFKCICPSGFSGPTCKDVECKSKYSARGSTCYGKMLKDKWNDAKCPEGEKFMSPENEDENKFIYDTFVKPSRRSFWMNARPCSEKLCAQDYSPMIYHNFGGGAWPTSGCFTMRYGNNGVWTTKNCELNEFFICKYRKENS